MKLSGSVTYFDPEYGGDIFLRNISGLSTGYAVLYSSS
jgi:hypothetical protein